MVISSDIRIWIFQFSVQRPAASLPTGRRDSRQRLMTWNQTADPQSDKIQPFNGHDSAAAWSALPGHDCSLSIPAPAIPADHPAFPDRPVTGYE